MADHIKQQYVHTEMLVRLDEQKVQTDIIIDKLDDVGPDASGLTNEQFETLKTDILDFNKLLTEKVTSSNQPPSIFDEDMQPYTIGTEENPDLYDRLEGIIDDETLKAYMDSGTALMYKSILGPITIYPSTGMTDEQFAEWDELDTLMMQAEFDQENIEDEWTRLLAEQNAGEMKTLYDDYIEGVDKQSKITPNWTTSVESPTYHITLYMVNIPVFNDPTSYLKENSDLSALGASAKIKVTEQQDLLNAQYVGIEDGKIVSETPRAIIVAESGVTSSFSIDNLVIEDLQSAPSNRGSTFSTESSFDISEPGGFSFITKVMAMSRMLEFSSINDARFVIQVDFMARDATTGNNISYPSTMTSDKKPTRSLYYPVMVSSIQSSTDASGSNYRFKCIHQNTQAAYNRINSVLTLNNVVTVGDLLDKLQSELNSYERRIADVGEDTIISDVWAIRFNIAPKDNGSLPSEQEGIANMLDAEFLNFPLVEATHDQLKTESDPVKSTSMTKKQDPNVKTKDEKIEQSSLPCGPIKNAAGETILDNNRYNNPNESTGPEAGIIDAAGAGSLDNFLYDNPDASTGPKTKQQVDAESKTREADGNQYELVKTEDPVSWLRQKLTRAPLFSKIAKDLVDEFKKEVETGELPPYDLIPKIVIDTATHSSANKHTRTGKYAKTTILNIQIVWESIPGLDIANHKFQKRNFKKWNILKRYNYMFSGENTEVTNFDLSHRMLFNNIKYIDASETDIHITDETSKLKKTDKIPKYLADLEVNEFGRISNIDMRPSYVIDEMPNQSSINNSGESTEDNKDAQLAAKFLDEQNRMIDNNNIDLSIIGDPDWMVGRDTILSDSSHPIISNFIAEGDGDLMSPQLHHSLIGGVDVGEEDLIGVAPTSDVQNDLIGLYMRTPTMPCISFINFLPSNSIFEAWDGDKSLFDIDVMTSGVYTLHTIQHTMRNGSFTQRLSGYREANVKTSFVQNEIRGMGDNK